MKKALFLFFGLIIIVTSCTKKEGLGLRLSAPPWVDNEVNKYHIMIAGMPIGSYVLTIKLGRLGADETIEVTALSCVTGSGGETRDSSWMVLRRDDLKPIRCTKTLVTQGTMLKSEISYTKDKASIKATLPMGEKSLDIPIGVTHFDNEQVTTLLRAIDLGPAEEKELNIVVGLGGTSVPVKIKAMGEEKITVPAGEIACNKFQMTVAGRPIDVWYEKTGMKRMVRYSDANANMVMELQ